jgi:hypothetical protein
MLVAYRPNVQCLRNLKVKETRTNSTSPTDFVSIQTLSHIFSMYFPYSASNIATKMNAKLSTIYDKAVSWTSFSDEGQDQLTWGKPSLRISY